MHAPVMLAFVKRTQRNVLVPVHEQWLSAGAVLGQLLFAAHALGYGAIVLSGERCQDEGMKSALELEAHEVLGGSSAWEPSRRRCRRRQLPRWRAFCLTGLRCRSDGRNSTPERSSGRVRPVGPLAGRGRRQPLSRNRLYRSSMLELWMKRMWFVRWQRWLTRCA